MINDVVAIVLQAGKMLLDREGVDQVKEKGLKDYVTAVDLQVQDFIERELFQLDKSIAFYGEEQDKHERVGQGLCWVLDPVDGTTNLIHDFKHSVVSLALYDGEAGVFGVIYNPFHQELFTAERGKGAYLNGKKIQVSGASIFKEAIFGMGTAPGRRDRSDATFRRMKSIYDQAHDVRRLGSAALEMAYVACGRLDGFFEEGLHWWDYGAGKIIIEEAGGFVEVRNDYVLAVTPELEASFKEALRLR